MSDDRPNILMILTDQHCFDVLGCMGHPLVKTPHLDALAEQGVLFRTAYTPSPVCGPARAAIFSGLYPPGCGVVRNWTPFKPGIENQLVSERLRQSGYQTGMAGKLHFVPHDNDWGFEYKQLNDGPYSVYADDSVYSAYVDWLNETLYVENPDEAVRLFDDDEIQHPDGDLERFILGRNFIPESHHMTPWTIDRGQHFLDQRDPDRPFFLYLGLFGPHQPWAPPGEWADCIDPADVELPPQFEADMDNHPIFQARKAQNAAANRARFSRDDYRRILANYYGNVMMIDHYLGQLFDRLKRDGLWERTTVVFSADHGDHNGQFGLFFKGDMYESAIRVPLIIKPPGPAAPGRIDQPVSILDLYGTLLDAGGVKGWDGVGIEAGSLWPLTTGRADDRPESASVYAIHGHLPNHSLAMLHRGPMKLTRMGRGAGREPTWEYFDLRDAVVEAHNRYNDPPDADQLASMQHDLQHWWLAQAEKYPAMLVQYNKQNAARLDVRKADRLESVDDT
jgi:arylsulfatase A-like enzyme